MARNYGTLQRNRLIVAGLTLGLLTVMFGVILDVALTGQRTTIAAPTKKLIAPLNPQLDLTVLERLEAYELVTFDQAREGVRQARQDARESALVTVGDVVDPASSGDGGADGFSQVLLPETPSQSPTPAPTPEPDIDALLSTLEETAL